MAAVCCCSIPLQRGVKYIAIFDVIFGILGSAIMAGVLTDNESRGGIEGRRYSFVKAVMDSRGFVIAGLISYVIQFLMGIALYFAAVDKNRNVCRAYLVTTGVTAIFTGVLIRLYEMAVVYEYTRELKEEQEVTYFPGQQPQQGGAAAQTHHPDNKMPPLPYPPQPQVGIPIPAHPQQQNVSTISGPSHLSPLNVKYFGHNQYKPSAPNLQGTYPESEMHPPPPSYDSAFRLTDLEGGGGAGGGSHASCYPPVTSSVYTYSYPPPKPF